jgi:sec-independent protein translocase protein TatA
MDAMPNVGLPEIAIVLIIALIVFGPKRLPELGRSLGRGIREFRGSISGDHDEDKRRHGDDAAEPAGQREIEAPRPAADPPGDGEPVVHDRR